MIPERTQRFDEVVDVVDWKAPDGHEFVYAEGSRAKRLLICPDPAPFAFLRPGYRYLLKESSHRYPEQFWVEILAYRLGCAMGVPVPPAFVAVDSRNGICAALIEWFYDEPQRYVSGGEYMKRLIKDYDYKTGRQHNFEVIALRCRVFQRQGLLPSDWSVHWARVLVLDSLMGNTDRHQDNWGVVWGRFDGRMEGRLSPAFDNGTSMAHEIRNQDLAGFTRDSKRLAAYVRRGRHHMKWRQADTQRLGHGALLARYCGTYAAARPLMLDCLSFRADAIERIVLGLKDVDVAVPLSVERAEFMLQLLAFRRERLLQELTDTL